MADLTETPGVTLEQILGQYNDEPLENIAAFDRLYQTSDRLAIRRLVDWVEAQSVCDSIIKWHGFDGLKRVLQGIARAASQHKVTMGDRVAAVAGANGMKVV